MSGTPNELRELLAEQAGSASEEQAVGAALVDGQVGEEADEQRPDEPADKVDTDDVERVVIT